MKRPNHLIVHKYLTPLLILLVFSACKSRNTSEVSQKFTISKFDSSNEYILVLEKDSLLLFDAHGFDYENDLAILKYNDGNYQTSTVVPVKNNSLNKYKLSGQGIHPFMANEKNEVVVGIHFSGNHYLEQYQIFLNWAKQQDTSDLNFPHKIMVKAMEFSNKTNHSQFSGFQLFSGYQSMLNKHPKLAEKIKEFCCGKEGQFYELVCSGRSFEQKVESGECVQHDIDTLVFQLSKNTILGDSPVGKEIVVLTYWATWCGPCKAVLENLNVMSEQYFKDKPVLFLAISIDEDVRKSIQFASEHPEHFSHQAFSNDNGCMKLNYNIVTIPQTFIYNKNGKLVVANPEKSEIKKIIDGLLDEMK